LQPLITNILIANAVILIFNPIEYFPSSLDYFFCSVTRKYEKNMQTILNECGTYNSIIIVHHFDLLSP
ncbi:hypothetical protein J4G37_48345, partial [Microvirga sp. 3-52]|nr:hypothetical protein [Microvirga sp. 3-52]